jgi:hypothetical protein
MTDSAVKAQEAKSKQSKTAKTQTMADILAAKKPNRRTIDVILDSDMAGTIRLKEQELAQLKNRRGKSLADGIGPLETELDELYEQAADLAVTFTFQDIGRRAFDTLVLAHQPTPEQKKHVAEMGGGILEYNIDTFPPALMAASAADPEMTLEEAEEIFNEWSSGDAEILFTTALLACKERASVPLSRKGTGQTGSSN